MNPVSIYSTSICLFASIPDIAIVCPSRDDVDPGSPMFDDVPLHFPAIKAKKKARLGSGRHRSQVRRSCGVVFSTPTALRRPFAHLEVSDKIA